MTLRRLALTVFVLLVAALAFVVFGPAIYGPALLSRIGGAYQVSVSSISGPLWKVRVRGLKVTGPGVQVQAQQAGVGLAALDLFGKVAKLNVLLSNGQATIDLKKLLDGLQTGGTSTGSGWQVLPGDINVRDVKLNFNGQGLNVPNGTFSLASVASAASGGQLKLTGQTGYGDAAATLKYGEQVGPLSATLDFEADARLVNYYWKPGGVTAGRVSGQYRFGGGPIDGEFALTSGAARVAQAPFVTLTGASGQFTHKGNIIQGSLSGQSVGGPISAQAKVDIAAQRWQVVAQATPSLAALGESLGVPASGTANLTALASGWTSVKVSAQVTSQSGSFASIPYQTLKAAYAFTSQDAEPVDNRLTFTANPALLGEKQQLTGTWDFGQSGTLSLGGELAQQPLNLQGQISADNVLSVQGRGLGGPVSARYDLGSQQLRAQLSPAVYGLSGQLSIQGKPSNLALRAEQLQVGPLTLSGTGTLDAAGLRASLGADSGGTVSVSTDRQFAGRWNIDALSLAGAQFDGSGQIELQQQLSGTLSASVPGVTSPLSGPIALNWQTREGNWQAGAQRLSWDGDTFALRAEQLQAAGLSASGNLTYNTVTRAVGGLLTASGNGVKLTAAGEGQTARLTGSVGGVQLTAQSELQAPFTTRASVNGTTVSGVLSVDNGVNFTLQTGDQTARGKLNGSDWDVTGGLDLAALRPLLGSSAPELSGQVEFNLAGQGGTARVQAQVAAAAVNATLTRRGGSITAQTRASLSDLTAALSGQVFPQVQLSGPLSWNGAGGPQSLQARISGPYGKLSVRATGQTTPISTGSVNLPAQALRVSGSLTPSLALSGTWGELGLTYRDGQVAVSGNQQLSVAGQSGSVNVNATWQPDYSGELLAAGQLGEYRFRASGPWTGLNVSLSGAGFSATGRANARTRQYALDVNGTLPGAVGSTLGGLKVNGQLRGQDAAISGTLQASDRQGGNLDLALNSLTSFRFSARNFRVAGQTLEGNLRSDSGRISGTASLGPLEVKAQNGQFTASGSLYQHTINASGQLVLPSTLSNLQLRVSGPYLSAQASGSGSDLRGSLTLKAQQYSLSAASLTAKLPAQTFALRASLSPLSVEVGGLKYAGNWSGSLPLRYALAGQTSTLQLSGQQQALFIAPQGGAISGRAQVLPELSGNLKIDLSILKGALPAQVQGNLVAGVLSAALAPQGASLNLSGGRWLGQVLGLSGRVSWASGLSADAVLTSPGSRLPVSYNGTDLIVQNAVLDARDLKPFIDASGQLRASLSLPGLQLDAASGTASLDVKASGQTARGILNLRGGQLSGNLSSTLGGRDVSLNGALYPQADAAFSVDGLRGTLSGNANAAGAPGAWTAQVSGLFEKREVTARASLSQQAASLSGTLAGLNIDLTARAAGAGIADWTLGGTFAAADLTALSGQSGQLAGTLSGTLQDLRAQASGNLAGVNFSLPARYRGGVLSVADAAFSTNLAQSAARGRLSGQVYPALDLSGSATLAGLAPGSYRLSAFGGYAKPRVTLDGQLSADVLGLGIAGTRLSAALSGQDFVVRAQGDSLSAQARGRTDYPNFIQSAKFTVHAPYTSGQTRVRLDGPLAWNAKSGWQGELLAAGDAPGGKLNAALKGSGPLALSASLGPARISGTLGASLPVTPGGTLRLDSLDIGAFWQRPDLLSLSGRARLGGPSWTELSAAFAGRLVDAGGQLSGDLSGSYAPGQARLSLTGQQLQGQARLDGSDFSASLNAQNTTLARLLPPALGVNSLRFTGILDAAGSTSAGLKTLNAHSLYLSGSQQQVGQFVLSGSSGYGNGVALADLRGQAFGGTLSAVGDFASGLKITARDLRLSQYGLQSASGEVTLRGNFTNPSLSGTLSAARPEGVATAQLSGFVQDPRLHLKAVLAGPYSGTLYADARDLDLSAQTAQLRLYGNAAYAGNRAELDLSGVWPKLRGTATAQLAGLGQPLALQGNGDGSYALSAGTLGAGTFTLSGLVPDLQASATLTPLPLLGASGKGQLQVNLSGPVNQLQAAASGSFTGLSLSGVSLPDTSLSVSGPVSQLTGEVRQGGGVVATLQGQQVTLSGLNLDALSSSLKLSGSADLSGQLDGQLTAQGLISGAAKVRYGPAGLATSGTLAAAGVDAAFDLSASRRLGWRGTLSLSGGPQLSGVGPVLSETARLRVSGALTDPQLAGTLGLVGARASLVASPQGAQLRFQDGPTAQASGILVLSKAAGEYVWSGQSQLMRPEGSLKLGLSGALARPVADLTLRRGGWTAQGQGSLDGARLTLSDGSHSGLLTYDKQVFKLSAENLDLARLGIADLSGSVSAVGAVDQNLSGAVSLSFSDLSGGATLPYLNLPLQGSGTAAVQLVRGQVRAQLQATAPYGRVSLTAQQQSGQWQGRLQAQLSKDSGTLSADLRLGATGVDGQVTLSKLPLEAAGQNAALTGSATFSGQSFVLNAEADSAVGRAQISGDGNLAELLPFLTPYTALKASTAGYRVQVGVSSLDLAKVSSALLGGANLGGLVSGQLTLSEGSGTFVLSSPALRLNEISLPARIDGNLAGGDWRLRGFVGNSTLFGAITSGQLSVRSQLEALPVGNLISAFTGKLPGNGIVTGIARLDTPIADPLSGKLTLVAERVRVTAGQDTLIGSGSLEFAERELRRLKLNLSGAGQWDISGQYTRQKVEVRAAFTDTTFTPALNFIPSLSDLTPALKGSLTFSVGGSYEQPTASLSGSNLVGSVSGIALQLPALSGQLTSDGLFTAQSRVQASGALSANGTVHLAGQLTNGNLSNTLLRYQGNLSAEALGNLGSLDASLTQGSGAWTVRAVATQGGSLTLSGQLSPDINLSLVARNYNLPISVIYARESSLNGTLSAAAQGQQIVVDGNLNFARLLLGRVGQNSLPGTPTTAGTASPSDAASSFVSPLPNELTVFPSANSQKPVSPFLQRIVLNNIPIRAPSNILVDESLAQAELSADLMLSGSAAAPRLSGNVTGLRGNLLLRDNSFTLQQAQASFDGSSLYPVFSVTARGQVPDQNGGQMIGVQLQADGSFVMQSGERALQLNTLLSCTTCTTPDTYTQAELYSLLALGTPDITTLGSNIGALGQSAVSTALNVFVLGELQRNIARALGVSVFRISSNLITPDGKIDAKFTVGTYLSKQFYLQYQVDLSGQSLLDATYTTPDNRFTFRASTPFSGLDLQSVQPSFSVGYNVSSRSRLTLGVQSGNSTRFSVGYVYKY